MALFDFASSFLTNTFIFQTFVPFIILFAVIWGLLAAINRFNTKTNTVIAVGFALIAAYSNPFVLSYIAALGSSLALVLFVLLFVFGVIRWGLGRGRDVYFETSTYRKQYEHYGKELEKIESEVRGGGLSDAQMARKAKEYEDIKKKMAVLDLKMKAT